MSVVLTVFIILASLLMIGIVLVQKSKGGGLASNFASSNQIMGVRKTTDFVEKATWTLAVVIMVLSIASTFVGKEKATESVVNRGAENSTEETTTQGLEVSGDVATPNQSAQ